jgi:mono/diheme cytochrome c family protein
MAYRDWISSAALLIGAATLPATAQQPGAAPAEESAEQLPAGPGRDEAFGMCSACHAYRLVAAQSMSRERWDDTMTLMTEKHGMPKLESEDRKLILEYLAKTHPPKKATGTGGFQIPFAPQ